ncbi:PREDICTED: uridine phosphorylase 1-like isoform X1 [Drosophila arizonae]|uniref:Uridine phosphorylase n=2 Tax=Drosophila arizonae TaxID=7263 RepID=A0ABM1PNY3_DROAR|nr:PREDICTED: uridine phosphorylase 1-like isoform X1 [Drosophila arizonae]
MGDKCEKNMHKNVCDLKAMVNAQNKRIDELIRFIREGSKTDIPQEMTWCTCNLNPYLECLNPDILYHLNLDTKSTDFPKVFGDVRFVCLGGTGARMEKFANFIISEIGLKLSMAVELRNISADGHRYALFKVGPVLVASHGIGGPSISIVLHELIKLVHHAKCQDPVFFRMGTCGGIGVEPGTLVITSQPLDGQLRPVYEVVVHTQPQLRPALLDQALAKELIALSNPCEDGYDTVLGKTLCANDFYEGQSRLDGAFCGYNPQKKMCFLQQISQMGVVNMEMESTAFAALTNQAGIRAAVICVAIINRMEGDQINSPTCVLKDFDQRAQILIARYMRKVLFKCDEDNVETCHCDDAPGCP